MGKAAVKLYRDPEAAKNAVNALRQQGYSLEEIGVIAAPANSSRIDELKGGVRLTLPQGPLIAAGAVAAALKNDNPEQALQEALGIPGDTFSYYQFGLATGSVLVSVLGPEEKLQRARDILRKAGGKGVEKTQSPGFKQASRMTSSDPLDAKVSGDFRRY